MKQEQVFGAISYEYALGCLQASARPPLSKDQWNRFQGADFSQAMQLLRELGYPSGEDYLMVLEQDWEKTADFIREISPQPELTQLLFFEEDASNLKLYRKAVLAGRSMDGLLLRRGSMDLRLLQVCAEINEYSPLGEELENALAPLQDTEDPCRISCVIDNAFFARAKAKARQGRSASLAQLLEQYGRGRNSLTAWRLNQLGLDRKDYAWAFLPTEEPAQPFDETLSPKELSEQVNAAMDGALEQAGWGDPMGVIAGYFFQKKLESKALGQMLCEKKIEGGKAK